MKKGILLYLPANDSWIGGVYYLKNVAYQLSLSNSIKEKYNIYLLTEEKYLSVYEELPKDIKIIKKKQKNILDKVILGLKIIFLYRVIYCFPFSINILNGLIKTIEWIPDFQYMHLPDFFAEEDRNAREAAARRKLKSPYGVILSSNDSLNDAKKYKEFNEKKTYVMHFVSYIEKDILALDIGYEKRILEKFSLIGKKYICVSNQFWKHKNHITVLEAIEKLKIQNCLNNTMFVFTGNLEDKRNPDYINRVKSYFNKKELKECVVNLGFLDRKEQLTIIKNAELVIQPSLFEGWGTVLEDCKVLDKTVILSDIAVHREQKNDKCIFI